MHMPESQELKDFLVCWGEGYCFFMSWLTWLASVLGLLLLVLWAVAVPMGCWRLMKEGEGWISGGV